MNSESPDAGAKLRDQLTNEPENWDARCGLAELLAHEGREGEAITVLDTAPFPPEFETHILKAAEVYTRIDSKRAVPLLHAFLQEVPDSALGHLAMAEAAAKMGDIHGANLYYKCAIDINRAYRDPDFEGKYGLSLENAPPAITAKTATIPLPVSELDQAAQNSPASLTATASVKESAPPAPESSSAPSGRRSSKKSGGGLGWVFTTLIAIAVFLICWTLTLGIIKSMLTS